MSARTAAGKILYGLLFVAAVPAGLALWARATEPLVSLPVPPFPTVGWAVAVAGLLVVLWGMVALRLWGKGLPMNAYPPETYVRRGPYRWVRHPIYVGFGLLVAGVSVALSSPSGLWLVTPATALAMVVLVLGFEGPALRKRFGERVDRPPILALPSRQEGRPALRERISVVVLVLVPWLIAYEGVALLGPPPDAVEAFLPFERGWPVLVWTEWIYASVYPFVILVPLAMASRPVLRWFAVRGLLATGVVTFLYLVIPLVAPPRPFTGGGLAGELLAWERSMAHTVAAFPSFHVLWTLLAAEAWSQALPRIRVGVWGWAFLIVVSCVTTGMHAILDLAAAVVVWLPLRRPEGVWERLRTCTEHVANSWWEWRAGPVRLLGYGLYAGAAGGLGAWIIASLVGPGEYWGAALLLVSALLGAGLWAQKLEGSSVLSRPFGYFGSLVGAAAGAAAGGLLGFDTSLVFAAVALGAPFIQAIGRLRCLVQGCCHGFAAPEWLGIRYHDPRSRVCSIGGLRGVPLHPTPLYSLLANLVIGVFLARVWILGATEGMIIGLYLVLSGLVRFVEESYRGEPQTPSVAGLRLYQWLAVALLVVGSVVTTVARTPVPDRGLSFSGPVLGLAVGFGLLCTFAMGVDFPRSNRRFARLAPVERQGSES